jgi:hypothetical protein
LGLRTLIRAFRVLSGSWYMYIPFHYKLSHFRVMTCTIMKCTLYPELYEHLVKSLTLIINRHFSVYTKPESLSQSNP